MSKIDYEIDRNFGEHWSEGNSDREYHLIDPKEYDFFRETESRLGQLSEGSVTSLGLEIDVGETLTIGFGAIPKILARVFDVTSSIGIYGLVDNQTKGAGHRICGEISIGKSTKDIALNRVQKQLATMLSNLNMLKIDRNQPGEVSNAVSLEVRASAAINTMPLTKAGEISLKFDSSSGMKSDYSFGPSIGDKIGIGGQISIRGCMTFKETGHRYGSDLLPLTDDL